MPLEQRTSSGKNPTHRQRASLIKISAACERCRNKKVKCNGEKPCRICSDQGVECCYLPRSTNGRIKSGTSQAELQKRLKHAESLLDELRGLSQSRTPENSEQFVASLSDVPPASKEIVSSTVQTELPLGVKINENAHRHKDGPDITVDTGLPELGVSEPLESGKSHSRDEYQGSSSCLSICSGPGISWISRRIAEPNAPAAANDLLHKISRRLKLSKPISNERTPEPEFSTAWLYTQAYFDECFEATFYTIDRSEFESHLRQHYNGVPQNTDDHVRYALRNTIFAYGARLVLSRQTTWANAQTQAWCYFENALSVETSLLHLPGDISSVQVVLAMALFAEGAGCPHLEYLLISSALRMAQAKALHLSSGSRVTKVEEETHARRWLFWTIYCYEKHIAFRSGRPSSIDDDDIDCPLPTRSQDHNVARLQYFECYVQHSLIVSAILKGLSTVRARQEGLERKVEVIQNLDHRLEAWYASLPQFLRNSGHDPQPQLPQGIGKQHLQHIYLSYQATIASIHCAASHPWNAIEFHNSGNPRLIQQVDVSSSKLAEAARNIVLVTRSITIDGSAPTWLIVYYPLFGFINLFVHVLKSGSKSSIEADIGLLNMAAGYFGYLDYVSGAKISYSFLTKLPTWAQAAYNNMPLQDLEQMLPSAEKSNNWFVNDINLTNNMSRSNMMDFPPATDDWLLPGDPFLDDFFYL